MKKIIMGIVLSALLVPCFVHAEQDIAVSVAVVPFEYFSGERKTPLGRDVAVKLLQELSDHPLIITPDIESLKQFFSTDVTGAFSEERLRAVAEQLQVNFLLFGSITAVKESLSIDCQVFYNFPGDNYFKTYAEGPDLEKVVEILAGKLEQELLDKASDIPAAERPKIKLMRQPVQAADAADYEIAVDRELAAELAAGAAVDDADGQQADDADMQQVRAAESAELEDLEEEDAPGFKKAEKVEKIARSSDRERKSESLPLKLDQPVNISADALEYSNKDNSAMFRGNVVARQGDLVMFAEQMEATYAGKTEKGGIKKLIATGNVKIIQGERIATGKRIVFYGDEQKIVATGNPRVWQGDNVIAGDKITVFLKQDRSVVEGNSQDRVSATIYPGQKKSKKE